MLNMWPPSAKRDHMAVHVPVGAYGHDSSKGKRAQSCWRYWNRLSSLQRSLILLMIIFGTLSAIYILPTIYSDFINIDQLDTLSRSKQSGIEDFDQQKKGPENVEKVFAQNAIEEIKRKAKEHAEALAKLHNQNLPPKKGPPKKGPPSLKARNDDGSKKVEPDEPKQVDAPPKPDTGDHIVEYNGPRNERQTAVVGAFQHAWKGYKTYAWGHDELKPQSRSYGEWFGVGLTLIDSLDTMYIMGLKDEFKEARDWVAEKLNFDVNRDVNLFECTIRVLGGLLSTYHLTNDKVFLEKATDVGDRMMGAFTSGSPVPYSDVNLHSRTGHAPRWGPDSSTSEVTTIQLEFRDLSRATGDKKYEQAVDGVTKHVRGLPKKDGLVPIFINARTGKFRSSGTITLGARGDSYYEYLLKMWLQTGKIDDDVKQDFVDAVEGIKMHLLKYSEPNKLMYFGELLGGSSFSPKMDHLVCFMGGALALGAYNGLPDDHMELAKKITKTCWQMYEQMPTGLSPEIAYFNTISGGHEDIIVKPADTHNLLRPETVESLFVLYRLTGDTKYQDWGWKIFLAFEKYTKLKDGYSSINNVKSASNPGYRNKMESFFLGETLKYFYLLFNDERDLIPLDKWVFNTEAHPLPVLS